MNAKAALWCGGWHLDLTARGSLIQILAGAFLCGVCLFIVETISAFGHHLFGANMAICLF